MQTKPRKNRSKIWSMPVDDFKLLVSQSSTIGEILLHFELRNKGGNSNTVKRRIKYENIDMSHIQLGKGSNKGKTFKPRRSNQELFTQTSNAQNKDLKRRILKDKLLPYQCECGLSDIWNNKPLILQLDHINGNPQDNRLSNLRFLCPNCHSQTETYASKTRCPARSRT